MILWASMKFASATQLNAHFSKKERRSICDLSCSCSWSFLHHLMPRRRRSIRALKWKSWATLNSALMKKAPLNHSLSACWSTFLQHQMPRRRRGAQLALFNENQERRSVHRSLLKEGAVFKNECRSLMVCLLFYISTTSNAKGKV